MKTTYYLGAGASALAIPCVADLATKIREVRDFVISNGSNNGKITLQMSEVLPPIELSFDTENLSELISTFCDEIDRELSIDTLAKILFIQNQSKKYKNLKAIIYASFLMWKCRNGIDRRYNNFWATLMQSTELSSQNSLVGFGNDINILSWNYDTQLEDSLIRILHGGMTNRSFYITDNPMDMVTKNTDIPYLKLNGSAFFDSVFKISNSNSSWTIDNLPEHHLALLICTIITHPHKFESLIGNIKFGWEKQYDFSGRITKMKGDILDTRILVIIGYTFPSINHAVDSELIRNMPNLKKVYFQGVDRSDSEKIKDYFAAVAKVNPELQLLPIDAKGFFVPPEATLKYIEKGPYGGGDMPDIWN